MKIPTQNLGKVISIRGSVVDVFFEQHLPPIYTLLRTGENEAIAMEGNHGVSSKRKPRKPRGQF
jgi:F0F1-type ATP synthase beta subunit